MIKRNFIYSIESLRPTKHRDGSIMPHGFGFDVYLDTNFAKKAYFTELPKENRFREIARSILKTPDLNCSEYDINNAFMFSENKEGKLTCLLRSVEVPGNASDLSIDGSEYGIIQDGDWRKSEATGALEYIPHNVETLAQAYGLVSLFTTWANYAQSYLSNK